MRGRVARVVGVVLALVVLVGCEGGSVAPPEAAPTATASSPTASQTPTDAATPGCDARCRRNQSIADRCRELIGDVRLTWRVHPRRSRSGTREIGLRMVLVNRSDHRLTGETTGAMRVAGGPRPAYGISWGGSSADTIGLRPGATSRRAVWHERKPPGWRPNGRRVRSFRFDTYLYAPGRGAAACHVPARVVAPRGVVAGHPRGDWVQQPDV